MKVIFAFLLVVVAHSLPVKRQDGGDPPPTGGDPPPHTKEEMKAEVKAALEEVEAAGVPPPGGDPPPPPGGDPPPPPGGVPPPPGGVPPPPGGGPPPGGLPPLPTKKEVKAALKEAGINVKELKAKLEAYFSKPEVQAKLKEFVAKLFPEGTDLVALGAKLEQAFKAKKGKHEKLAAVLEDAGFDPEKLKAELKAALEEIGQKIKAFLDDPEVEAKIDAFVQKFLPPGATVADLKAKLEGALGEGTPEEKLEKLKGAVEASGIDFEAMGQKIKEFFENPKNTKKIGNFLKKVVPKEIKDKVKELNKEAKKARKEAKKAKTGDKKAAKKARKEAKKAKKD